MLQMCWLKGNNAVLPFLLSAEPLIGKAYVKQIIDKLHATLSEAKGMSDAGNMEPLVTFISDVAATFFSSVKGCLLLASTEELLMTVFQLRAQDQISTHLSGTDSKPSRSSNICLCRMSRFSISFNITPQIMSPQLCVLLLNACLFFPGRCSSPEAAARLHCWHSITDHSPGCRGHKGHPPPQHCTLG